jgi:hypothetical protein
MSLDNNQIHRGTGFWVSFCEDDVLSFLLCEIPHCTVIFITLTAKAPLQKI